MRELLMRDDAVQRPFKLAPATLHLVGDEFDHVGIDADLRIASRHFGEAPGEDLAPQIELGQFDVDHEAAHQARAHALVDGVELRRRGVGGDHDLALGVHQRIEGVVEFLRHRLALQELEVVDEQYVDRLEVILEPDRVARPERADEMIHEALGGDEQHLAFGMALAHPPGDGIEEMRLAETGGGMDEQRIEADRQARLRFRDALRRRVGKAVRSAGDEALESLARIERRSALSSPDE